MTGAESVLCEMFSCGSLDLKMLDDVVYDWGKVLDQADWPRADIDFNILMRGVIDLGIIEIRDAVGNRIAELEAIAFNERDLDSDEEEELMELRNLDPDKDIDSFHNCLDTHVWFEKNGDIYRRYLSDALDEFAENTGFEIG